MYERVIIMRNTVTSNCSKNCTMTMLNLLPLQKNITMKFNISRQIMVFLLLFVLIFFCSLQEWKMRVV